MDKLASKLPTHELIYRQIRDMIMFGELAPGQAVTIQGLVDRLGAGMTPVREAIRRLTAEGALDFQGNRRACVPQLTPERLEELAFARLAIEPRLAGIAANKLIDNDISNIEKIDDALNVAIDNGDVPAYLANNFHFHFALYELSGAHILLALANTLWLQFGPSLRVVCGRYGTYNLPDKHAQAMHAMKAGDDEGVARAIEEDILQGIEQVRNSLQTAK